MSHFEIFKDDAGQYRYRVRADNGEIVASSEAYDSRDNAMRGVGDLLDTTTDAKNQPIKMEDE